MNTAKIENLREKIRAEYRKNEGQNYETIKSEIDALNKDELDLLNNKMKRKKPFVSSLKSAQKKDYGYIKFRLKTNKINLNLLKTDNDNQTCLTNLFYNKELWDYFDEIVILIFKRGYEITDNDNDYFKDHKDVFLRLRYLQFLSRKEHPTNRWNELWEDDRNKLKVLQIIESAKRGKVFYWKYKNVFEVANEAITNYKCYWYYIDVAFNYYKFYDKIEALDKKGTFRRKKEALSKKCYDPMLAMTDGGIHLDVLLSTLYPELPNPLDDI